MLTSVILFCVLGRFGHGLLVPDELERSVGLDDESRLPGASNKCRE